MENLLPDAIVARLPHSDLINLVSRIRLREAEQGGTVPIVAIRSEPGAERLSADGYLDEPIDPWRLCRTRCLHRGDGRLASSGGRPGAAVARALQYRRWPWAGPTG